MKAHRAMIVALLALLGKQNERLQYARKRKQMPSPTPQAVMVRSTLSFAS